MPSTTSATTAAPEPAICDLLATWQDSAPPMNATNAVVADWFALSVRLLTPITSNPAHPQHAEACALAQENSHDALALREAGTAGER
ncbi:hypothetical protein [Lentzea flaviverrucosa]|uniref:Uncharacterized protein n=1 Tax=Lentzea flaviverrucosa TaxID=200379 RepID=A0A1H9XLT5_9PSEU|nr:hypothetical protein [Lentzea flaviverrucosa]RDI20332.1 hypothetical protein DFR72_115175 [Lentzea flaviverrucosa]SES46623.1 hypothetical protein SAMN05216195_115175 [Lentzea flaviverrucosa]